MKSFICSSAFILHPSSFILSGSSSILSGSSFILPPFPMFDPAFPPTNALLVSAQFRAQFMALFDLIQSIVPLSNAQVDGVTTLNPGDAANASVSVVGNTLHFTFGIPPGLAGPSVAGAIVDGVNTLPPGNPASVGVSFDGANVHYTFNIPRGNDGIQGQPGAIQQADLDNLSSNLTTAFNQSDGNLQNNLNAAITGTSSNSNGVALLNLTVSDPPQQNEVQSIVDKLNELINALRR